MEEITAVTLRRRYSAKVWKDRITNCRTSGQSVTAWCKANGINSKSYYRWERKLLTESGRNQAKHECTQERFAEISPISEKRYPAAAVLRGAGVTCEISNEIEPELLRAILAAMTDHA